MLCSCAMRFQSQEEIAAKYRANLIVMGTEALASGGTVRMHFEISRRERHTQYCAAAV